MIHETTPNDSDIHFSRSLMGKNDDEIKFRCSFELRQEVQRIAHSLGTTESDFMRELLLIRVKGLDHVRSLADARALAVAGPGLSGGTSAAQGSHL